MYYKICENCGAHLDPEERCDCDCEDILVEKAVFIVDYDLSKQDDEDDACLTVIKVIDNKTHVINKIYGEQAKKIYDLLTLPPNLTRNIIFQGD